MQTTMDWTPPAASRPPAIRHVTVVMPVAPPQTYLRWMRWCRRTERRARALIANGDLVTRLALHPHPAELFWDVIAGEISRQAGLAKRQGRTSVMPRIRTTDVVLVRALSYMDRRQRFLETGYAGRPQARMMAPLPEFVTLRARRVRTVAQQLAAPARVRRPRSVGTPAGRVQSSPRRRARADAQVRSGGKTHERRRPGQAA